MITIESKETLHRAVTECGILPFFRSPVPGLSVEEMAAPGILFGEILEGGDSYGCWDWKGPVIQEMDSAYGKFFRRKAGYVSLDLFPDFINYRRQAYPVAPGSTEAMILDIINAREGMTSSELRREIFGASGRKEGGPGRHSLEAPLQRLQMRGSVIIADFEYKHTSQGQRYGWGVALYTTPEIWFGRGALATPLSPADSLARLRERVATICPHATPKMIERLLI